MGWLRRWAELLCEGKIRSSLLKMLQLRCLLDMQRRNVKSWRSGLEFGRKIWAGNVNLRLMRIQVVFEALGADDSTQGVSIHNQSSVLVLNIKSNTTNSTVIL